MSFRATRNPAAAVSAFVWHDDADAFRAPRREFGHEAAQILPMPPPGDARQEQARLASVEREAFGKGYEAGERAGAEAGATRAEAMLRRLSETLDELGAAAPVDDSPDRAPDGAPRPDDRARIVRREVTLDQRPDGRDGARRTRSARRERVGDDSPAPG